MPLGKVFAYNVNFTKSATKSAFLPIALIVISSLGVVGCATSQQRATSPTTDTPSHVATLPTDVNQSPSVRASKTDIPMERATPEVAYERLSPSRIRIPEIDLTLEVSGKLTESVLIICTDIAVPVGFLAVFPANTEPSIIKEVELSALSLPLQLEPDWGGGGSGVDNGMFMAGGTQTYRVKTALVPGQEIEITVTATFSEYVGLSISVPLSIHLIVEPTSSTPEGCPVQSVG